MGRLPVRTFSIPLYIVVFVKKGVIWIGTVDNSALLIELEKERDRLNNIIEQTFLKDGVLSTEEILKQSQVLDILILEYMSKS